MPCHSNDDSCQKPQSNRIEFRLRRQSDKLTSEIDHEMKEHGNGDNHPGCGEDVEFDTSGIVFIVHLLFGWRAWYALMTIIDFTLIFALNAEEDTMKRTSFAP